MSMAGKWFTCITPAVADFHRIKESPAFWASCCTLHFFILFITLIGALLLSGSPIKLMIRGIGDSLDKTETIAAAKSYKIARLYCIGAGIIGAMTGWMLVLKNINDPAKILLYWTGDSIELHLIL